MFRKSRMKIVAAIMSVFLVLFAGTLCVIYFSSYIEVFQSNQEMLKMYAQAYWENGNPSESGERPPEGAYDVPGEHAYRLLSFHSVAFSGSGEVISIDNDIRMGVADEALTGLAEQLIDGKRDNGVSGNWVYYIDTNGDCTLVVLMDNMLMSGSMLTLLRYTVLFGSAAMVVLFLLSLGLARRIVQPLEESYRKQKQFISDAGHELKTPIAVISMNLEMLERENGQSKWLDNVKYETSRMANLVSQLLELARTERADPKLTRIDFGRLVTGGVLPFECIAFEKERRLRTGIQDGVYVLGDEEQLGNLVSVLLDNALTYAPKHSEIAVSLRAEHNRAVLSVANDGTIPEEQRKNLFERFYRADSSRGGESPHYGLGLAIAKAVVTAHRGKIGVDCDGSRVIFTASIPLIS